MQCKQDCPYNNYIQCGAMYCMLPKCIYGDIAGPDIASHLSSRDKKLDEEELEGQKLIGAEH